ncbi:SDR family NAD(P)-dependent oxidoreductase [Cohnella herbarum]|uniref:SDR family oxidoreductase n=1 Tax=Cohnella herbarum TaxID=2728023 RepID=A0A7Z2VF13_9BACL|nr:SDR family oxidoreductase [Cohnella herbarum]QJD81917.1 SDR family oxidoreductase [Cohnella herbarum]
MKNKIALVAGATSGIGKATANELATRGAIVFVGGRREQEGQMVVKTIKDNGGEAYFLSLDVTDEESVSQAMKTIADRYGRLDIAVNNAGVMKEYAPIGQSSKELLMATLNTNVIGIYLSMKYEILQMLQNGGGAIVNVSSTTGLRPYASAGAYVASKYAVEGLSKSAALDYASQGIRINTVAPGPTRTDMVGNDENVIAQYAERSPIKRIGAASEIAKGIVWLLSDEASYTVGTTLVIDGGAVMA